MKYSNYSQKDISLNLKNEEDISTIVCLCDALGNETRLRILQALAIEPFVYTVPELVKLMKIPTSTLLHHLKKLEKANIIHLSYRSSSHGTVRIVSREMKGAHLTFYYRNFKTKKQVFSSIQSVGVGMYSSFEADGSYLCLVKDKLYTEKEEIYNPLHYDAQLIASSNGRVTYEFSNTIALHKEVVELLISLEICSEAPYHDNNYMSDITFWINGKEITTYLSDGDYGDRVGILNPDYWPKLNTQYGKLINLTITKDGVFINELKQQSKYNLSNIDLKKGNKLTLTIGNKSTAEHVGGFNIFGKTFGDYPQDICLQFSYEE